MRRVAAIGSVTLALSAAFVLPSVALTEARIVDVDCSGLTVVQTGLPARERLHVEAIDAATARHLAEADVRSTQSGRLAVRLRANLRGVHRLHAEVSKFGNSNVEYGEADVDLDLNCRVTGTQPAVASSSSSPSAGPGSSAAGTATRHGTGARSTGTATWVVVAAAAAALAALGAAVALRSRRRRSAAQA